MSQFVDEQIAPLYTHIDERISTLYPQYVTQLSKIVLPTPLKSKSQISDVLILNAHNTEEEEDNDFKKLVHLKSTLSLYSTAISYLIRSIIHVDKTIEYWHSVQKSRPRRTEYVIQTSPKRIYTSALGIKAAGLDLRAEFRKAIHKLDVRLYNAQIRTEIKSKLDKLDGMKIDFAEKLGALVKNIQGTETRSLDEIQKSFVDKLSQVFDVQTDVLLRVNEKIFSDSSHTLIGRRAKLEISLTDNLELGLWTRVWPGILLGSVAFLGCRSIVYAYLPTLKAWALNAGDTLRIFATDWIYAPIKDMIANIRHDESAEIAIVSRESLQSDVASLERMVTTFTNEYPQFKGNADVAEGNITPILLAYERDLTSPLKNAIVGTTIRTLLIQVQKTKVDLEVALSGIDKLLKSQSLVFGLVGLTPSLLMVGLLFTWFKGSVYGMNSKKSRIRAVKLKLRDMEKLITSTNENVDRRQGLLICSIVTLRELGNGLLDSSFVDDLQELGRSGNYPEQKQIWIIERIWRMNAHLFS